MTTKMLLAMLLLLCGTLHASAQINPLSVPELPATFDCITMGAQLDAQEQTALTDSQHAISQGGFCDAINDLILIEDRQIEMFAERTCFGNQMSNVAMVKRLLANRQNNLEIQQSRCTDPTPPQSIDCHTFAMAMGADTYLAEAELQDGVREHDVPAQCVAAKKLTHALDNVADLSNHPGCYSANPAASARLPVIRKAVLEFIRTTCGGPQR